MIKMTKSVISFVLVQFFISSLALSAVQFEFLYSTGRTYTVESTVNQEVYVNNTKSHDARITNEIFVEEIEVQHDGSARIHAQYKTEDQVRYVDGRGQRTNKFYESTFSQDKYGTYILDQEAFMPVVRNVPVFPDYALKVGDTWTSESYEVHDFRDSFDIQEPYKIPFTAHYTYKGTEEVEGELFHIIDVNYMVMHESPFPVKAGDEMPVSTMSYSSQRLYWDSKKGCLDHYTEYYRIIMETSFGDRIEFVGDSYAKTTNFKERSPQDVLVALQNRIDSLELEDVSTHIAPEGLTLSLENIQFEAESAVLEGSTKLQLDIIAQILSDFVGRDILVTGHTALAGTAEGRKVLSEDRAVSVARYLYNLGIGQDGALYTQGLGASDPIANNDTSANKAKNRRVEITILDEK